MPGKRCPGRRPPRFEPLSWTPRSVKLTPRWHSSWMASTGIGSLDPLSLIINANLAELLLIGHFYDASIQQSRKTIDMDVTFAMAHNQLAQAYLQQQQYDAAIAELQKAIQLSEGTPTYMANLARADALS